MPIQWSGPTGGLGNRMLALASASALAGLLDTQIGFTWLVTPACPCRYSDLFERIGGLRVEPLPGGRRKHVVTCGWNPIRIFKGFTSALDTRVKEADFYYEMIRALRALRYSDDVREKISGCAAIRRGDKHLALHARRTDRYRFHRTVYRQKLSAFSIVRNTGMIKSLQYLLLPESWVRCIENRYLGKLLEGFLAAYPDATYTLYSDSGTEIEDLKQFIKTAGIMDERHYPAFCSRLADGRGGQFGIRDVHPRDALVDLLEMSTSDQIAQDNPASTFSLVAAVIGGVKIISKQPTHAFWRRMQAVLKKPPNEIVTDHHETFSD
jgi:hypothetical protein